MANDTDADSDTLSTSVVAQPAHGTLTLNSNGTFTYTPAAGFFGNDSFTYQDSDGVLTSSTATVTIAVTESVPVATNDLYTIAHGQTLTTVVGGYNNTAPVLYNDSDADHDTLTASVVTQPLHGTLTFNSNGTFVYTPAAGFYGTDSFTYQDSDGLLTSSTATAIIAVTESAPVASGYSLSVGHDKPLGGTVHAADSDGDTLTYAVVAQPAHGTVTLNTNGMFTYTPAAHYSGTDSFTYQANDGMLNSNVATVLIGVSELAPLATNDSYTVAHGQTLTTVAGGFSNTAPVLANDSDPDADPLTASVVAQPLHGTLTFNSNGTFAYTPAAGFYGTDSFTYQDTDGLLTSRVATVLIAVTESAPVEPAYSLSVAHDKTLSSSVHATDADGDALTYAVVVQPLHGTLTFSNNGTFIYAPMAGYSGTDAFTYQASDGVLAGNVATVTIAVTERAPTVKNDSYTVAHDQSLSAITPTGGGYFGNAVGVLGNDTDPDGDTMTAVQIAGVQHGSLTFNSDGTFVYTPAAGYSGPDSFTYQVSDGLLSSAVATVSIFVTELPPTARNDSYTVAHDQVLSATANGYTGAVGVLSNDTDADGDPMSAVLLTNVQHGSLIFNSDGTFTYVPNAGYSGADSFTYQDSDGILTGVVATVSINVTEAAPAAVNDSYTIAHDQILSTATNGYGNTAGVLANDTDSDADKLTATLVSSVQHGTLTFNSDGSFLYIPTAGYSGTDTFTYKASDGLLTSSVATVTITVNEHAPVAVNDSYTTAHDRTLATAVNGYGNTAGVLVNDTDAETDKLTATLVTGPAHGTLVLNADGTFNYVPTAGYSGTDSFTYKASDGLLQSAVATATITVTESAPVAVSDSYTIAHDQILSTALNGYGIAVGVLANDTDADGDAMTATLVAGVAHGTLTFNPDGTFVYIPSAGFSGTDTFTYQVSDGLLTSSVTTATITVTEPAPVAVNDSYTMAHDRSLTAVVPGYGGTLGVLSNDTDADSDKLTATIVANVQNGTLSFNSDGSFVYTPNAGYWGTDSFTYQVSDGLLTSNVATATITVNQVALVAVNDTYSIAHDHTLTTLASGYGATLGVLANDSATAGDTMTAILVSGVQHGVISLNADGSFVYQPALGYSGTDSFTYQVKDGLVTSNVATATITVSESAPVGVSDAYTIGHDRTLTATASGYGTPLGVLNNDTDADSRQADGDPPSRARSTGPCMLNPDGSFTYVPATGFWGTDSFTYQASDGLLTSAVTTATINVTESAPAVVNDAYNIGHDHTLTAVLSGYGTALGVLANDTDADGDKMTATLVTGVQHGTLTLNADGTFTYVPTAGFVGADSFTYKDSDGTLTSAVATATINVTESAPAAVNDTYSIVDHTLTVAATGYPAGVLVNDTDADSDKLTATLVSSVLHGTLTFNSDGSFTYVPSAGYSGTDSFTYQDSDGLMTSNVATATITVNEHVPVVQGGGSFTVAHDKSLAIYAYASDADSDSLTITVTAFFGAHDARHQRHVHLLAQRQLLRPGRFHTRPATDSCSRTSRPSRSP